jgi:hypothetical protein
MSTNEEYTKHEARRYGKQVGREIEDNSMSVEDRLLSGGAVKLVEIFPSHFAKGVAEVTGQDRREVKTASLRAVQKLRSQ